MTKKLNGFAPWCIVLLAVLALAFNTGITYNHIGELTIKVGILVEDVADMKTEIGKIKIIVSGFAEDVKKLDTACDNIKLILAARDDDKR